MPDSLPLLCNTQAGPPVWPEARSELRQFSRSLPPRHAHVIWSLSLGGAERIVSDLARSLAECGAEADIVVLQGRKDEHTLSPNLTPGVRLHRLGALPWPERYAYAAGVAASSERPIFCHLMMSPHLEQFWRLGCRTAPVVHNGPGGWPSSPQLLNTPNVPFVVACGDFAAGELRKAGLTKPIVVLRHVVRQPAAQSAPDRARIRAELKLPDTAFLVGMIGRVVAQKRYTRAARLLAELRRDGRDARLVIAGSISGAEGETCARAVLAEAARLRVQDAVSLLGSVPDAARLLPGFDVFLNTSLFEGVSVATMEAIAFGVPVVSADTGGQAEAVGASGTLLPAASSDAEWTEAIVAAASRSRAAARQDRRARHGAAHLWPWVAALGPGASVPRARTASDLLFVTGSMDVGGAQRSLCNLAEALARRGVRVTVAVVGPVGVPGFMDGARAAGAEFVDLSEAAGPTGGLHARAGRVMALALERSPSFLVFWNMDAATKLMTAKAMAGGPVRLCDVSPGPMLYTELDAEAELARSLSTSADAYLGSLDLLVCKYAAGGPPLGRGRPRSSAVIPNGVPAPHPPLPPGEGPAPPNGADPELAVVTVGRLVPAKRPELLPLVAQALARMLPGATLTVVGGVHGEPGPGWTAMLAACGGGVIPPSLAFARPDHRATGFLGRFAAFYMVSRDQGCPNASLEAMACGLPVVANPDGGTAEQVVDGVTGRLVPEVADPVEYANALANALADILRDPDLGCRMGAAGRTRALTNFSMATMAEAYSRVLLGR